MQVRVVRVGESAPRHELKSKIVEFRKWTCEADGNMVSGLLGRLITSLMNSWLERVRRP